MTTLSIAKRMTLLVAIASLVGCGTSEVGDTRGVATERRVAEARCAARLGAECAPFSGLGFGDIDRCVAVHLAELAGRARAIDRGLVQVDDDALRSCLSDVGCLSSDTAVPALSPRDPLAACRVAFHGDTALGDACQVDEECARGLHCEGSAPGACGRCAENRDTGAVCTRDGECHIGALCEGDQCVAAVQGPDAGDGAPCGRIDTVLGVSARYASCEPGLHCIGLPGTCARPVDEGGACARPDQCGEGLECIEGTCVGALIARREGDACGGAPPVRCDYEAGLACSDGRCVRRLAAGDPCDPGDLELRCPPDRVCDTGVCRGDLATGESCSLDGQCASRRCAEGRCGPEVCM